MGERTRRLRLPGSRSGRRPDAGPVEREWFGRTRRQLWQALGMLRVLPGRINRLLGRVKPPHPDDGAAATPTKPIRTSMLAVTLCLGMAALMVTGKIVEIADRLPLGPERDRWLEAAVQTDRVAHRLAMNRPYDLLRDLRGAGDDLGQQIDVIGDLEELRRLAAIDGPAPEQASVPALAVPSDEPGDEADASGEETAGSGGSEAGSADASVPSDEPGVVADASGEAAAGSGGGEAAGSADASRQAAVGSADASVAADAAGSGGGGAGSAAGSAGPGEAAAGSIAGGVDRTAGAAPPATAVPVEPAYVRPVPVSEESPLKILVAGDSQAFHLGHSLLAHGINDLLDLTLDQRHSTGLARPGYFNWPVHFFAIVLERDPELVVATLGSNDWQNMTSDGGETLQRGSEQWKAEWRRRLSVTVDVLEAPHRRVIWVGLPPARNDANREGYAVMNELAASVSAEREFVTMIDIWDVFGGDQPYRESVPPPQDAGGTPVDVRLDDGVHLNRAGAEWVADLIAVEIDRIISEISPVPELGDATVPSG